MSVLCVPSGLCGLLVLDSPSPCGGKDPDFASGHESSLARYGVLTSFALVLLAGTCGGTPGVVAAGAVSSLGRGTSTSWGVSEV